MPPRGYRDENKRLWREFLAGCKRLDRERYASWMEHRARSKAAFKQERDLPQLVRIAVLQDRDGLTPYAAAAKIAEQIGGDARLRHANRKRLYGKFQTAPALYRRLALALEDPADAAEREISESLGITPRADEENQREASRKEREILYKARLLEWAHQALEKDELARAVHASRSFKDMEEFARTYLAVYNTVKGR